jgi:hypothetical protein
MSNDQFPLHKTEADEEIARLQRALDLKAAALRQAMADNDQLRAFARCFLDPEMYGHTVTAEIRNAARRALGIPASETPPPAQSFNDGNAWRDAISTPRKA